MSQRYIQNITESDVADFLVCSLYTFFCSISRPSLDDILMTRAPR